MGASICTGVLLGKRDIKGASTVFSLVLRLLPNGEIDFIGRNDGQVKVREFRIELTEVEGVIRSLTA